MSKKEEKSFDNDYKMLDYFQKEFMYRHKHFWNIAIKSFLLTITITIIPMVDEIFGISFNDFTNDFLLIFPAIGGIVAIVSSIILLYESERMKRVNDVKFRINKKMNKKYQYVFHDKNSSYNKVTLAKALIFFTLEFELIVVTMVVFMLIPNIF